MEALFRNIPVIIAAVVALVLHVVVAPALSIHLIRPNVLLAFAVVLSIVRPNNVSMVVSCILGLVGGCLTAQPFGLMAAIMVVISFLLGRVFSVMDGDNLFMAAISIAVSMLLAELAYGFLLIQFGMDVSFFGLLLYRILPCVIYDCIFALILYPLVHHFVGAPSAATQIPVAQLR